METAFGDIIPFALGIAISPIPVIATILMLLSPRARATASAFSIGWVVGVSIAAVIFTSVGALVELGESDTSAPIRGVVRLALATALLLLAIRAFRRRPRGDASPTMPSWMASVTDMTTTRASALGLMLAVANPKNLVMAASAGIAVGHAGPGGAMVVGGVVFVIVAVSTVVAPVVVFLVAPERVSGALERLREWLVRNNSVIITVLLVFLAVSNLGKGIDAF